MKILVTGGAGYIGSNLIKRLVKDPKIEKITSLDNYFTGQEANHVRSHKIEYIRGNTWDILKIFKTNNFDLIYHFGEYSRIAYSFEDIDIVYKSIITGTYSVLRFALLNNSKVIYSASSSKFGNNGKDENLSPYAFFKSKNVELIKNFHRWFNLKYEICYFFNVYGDNHIKNGKYATVIAIFERQYANNEPLTVVSPGTQTRDFTHVNDICNGIIKVSEINRNHEFHLRFGKNYPIIEVAQQFSSNIEIIGERKGERFISEDFNSDTEEILGWKAEIELYQYIKSFKTSVEKHTKDK